MRHQVVLLVLLLSGIASIMAGCSLSGSDGSPTATTNTTTPTAPSATSTTTAGDATPTPSTSASPAAEAFPTPVYTDGFIDNRLYPPDFWLMASAGEQQGNLGPYFWVLPSTFVADAKGTTFEIHQDPLRIQSGEDLRLRFENGPMPETLTLKVYPEDGNTTTVHAKDGEVTKFKPTTEAVTTVEVSADTPQWAAELEPGAYFVWLHGTWPTPYPTKTDPLEGQFAFRIQVE